MFTSPDGAYVSGVAHVYEKTIHTTKGIRPPTPNRRLPHQRTFFIGPWCHSQPPFPAARWTSTRAATCRVLSRCFLPAREAILAVHRQRHHIALCRALPCHSVPRRRQGHSYAVDTCVTFLNRATGRGTDAHWRPRRCRRYCRKRRSGKGCDPAASCRARTK